MWRIAMDAMGYEYAREEILTGPDSEVLEFGGIPQYLSDGTELWDHALSDSELDLICGVYSAPTGNVHVSYVLLDPY